MIAPSNRKNRIKQFKKWISNYWLTKLMRSRWVSFARSSWTWAFNAPKSSSGMTNPFCTATPPKRFSLWSVFLTLSDIPLSTRFWGQLHTPLVEGMWEKGSESGLGEPIFWKTVIRWRAKNSGRTAELAWDRPLLLRLVVTISVANHWFLGLFILRGGYQKSRILYEIEQTQNLGKLLLLAPSWPSGQS